LKLPFFLDQCVPADVSNILRAFEHEATLLRDAIPPASPDAAVLGKARELDAILVSLNGDFADIVKYPPRQSGGIIAIQLHNHPEMLQQLMKCACYSLTGPKPSA
jgi:predicted nuclease of predicted toxin-antitoxin system